MDTLESLKIKTTHYILAGFSLVVGLSWNETIKNIIGKVIPNETNAILAKIIYSLVLTLVLIIIIRYLPDTKTEIPNPIRTEIERFQNFNSKNY